MKLTYFEVRAEMTVTLRTLLVATDHDHAIAQARELANDGLMEEIPHFGEIHSWRVLPHPGQRTTNESTTQ